MRAYEVIFIAQPNLSDEQLEAIIKQFREIVTKENAEVIRVERWGKRRLAYQVKKYQDGFFVFFLIQGPHAAITALERRLKLMESIIRFLTVRVDRELQKTGKWPLQVEQEVIKPAEKAEATPAVEPGTVTVSEPTPEKQPAAEEAPGGIEKMDESENGAGSVDHEKGTETPDSDYDKTE
jgi:small subunit ribosomal protein S6